jgi:hypothetical protein
MSESVIFDLALSFDVVFQAPAVIGCERAAENTPEQLYRGGIIILRLECSQLTV